MLRWMLKSSVTDQFTATWQARRGGTPCEMSWPAYMSRRVLAPSANPCSFRLRIFSPSLASWSAVSSSVPDSCAMISASVSRGG